MIEIKKGSEPRELLAYRQTEYASYDNLPSDVKKKVIESLLSEQGHLCAYCMCRIDAAGGKRQATIEHCIPQFSSDNALRLSYKNMAAVCRGNRDAHSNAAKSCDARRGTLPPDQQSMKKLNIFDGNTLRTIQYSSDGTIFSADPDADEDLNKRLNLNCEARRLKECRKQALRTLHSQISKKYPGKTAPKRYFQTLLTHYTEQKDQKEPYVGIIIDWLSKKI